MSSGWGLALAIGCWVIASLLAMGLLLSEYSTDKGLAVVRTFLAILWQAGIFGIAGFVLLKTKQD